MINDPEPPDLPISNRVAIVATVVWLLVVILVLYSLHVTRPGGMP